MVQIKWTDSMVIKLLKLANQSGTYLVSGKGFTAGWNSLVIDILNVENSEDTTVAISSL